MFSRASVSYSVQGLVVGISGPMSFLGESLVSGPFRGVVSPPPPDMGYNGIRLLNRRYASYWSAFLQHVNPVPRKVPFQKSFRVNFLERSPFEAKICAKLDLFTNIFWYCTGEGGERRDRGDGNVSDSTAPVGAGGVGAGSTSGGFTPTLLPTTSVRPRSPTPTSTDRQSNDDNKAGTVKNVLWLQCCCRCPLSGTSPQPCLGLILTEDDATFRLKNGQLIWRDCHCYGVTTTSTEKWVQYTNISKPSQIWSATCLLHELSSIHLFFFLD